MYYNDNLVALSNERLFWHSFIMLLSSSSHYSTQNQHMDTLFISLDALFRGILSYHFHFSNARVTICVVCEVCQVYFSSLYVSQHKQARHYLEYHLLRKAKLDGTRGERQTS